MYIVHCMYNCMNENLMLIEVSTVYAWMNCDADKLYLMTCNWQYGILQDHEYFMLLFLSMSSLIVIESVH